MRRSQTSHEQTLLAPALCGPAGPVLLGKTAYSGPLCDILGHERPRKMWNNGNKPETQVMRGHVTDVVQEEVRPVSAVWMPQITKGPNNERDERAVEPGCDKMDVLETTPPLSQRMTLPLSPSQYKAENKRGGSEGSQGVGALFFSSAQLHLGWPLVLRILRYTCA